MEEDSITVYGEIVVKNARALGKYNTRSAEAEEWLSRDAKANPAKYRYPFAA
jgi:hypothetical protein